MTHDKQGCIEACIECALECEHCLAACLNDPDVAKMVDCIRLDQDCAQICLTAAAFLSRNSSFSQEIGQLCADICEACGAACERHEVDHCQICAQACHQCAFECRQMVAAIAS